MPSQGRRAAREPAVQQAPTMVLCRPSTARGSSPFASIVSVVALVPIAIPLGLVGGFFGLVALGLTAAVILGVNAIVNGATQQH